MKWIILAALLGFGAEASAYRLRVNGLVTDYTTKGTMAQARVRLYKDGELQRMQMTNGAGRYSMVLDNHANYVIRVDAPGYQVKCITIDTHGPEWERDSKVSNLELEMRLLQQRDGVDLSFLDLPLGIARFEPTTGHTRWSRTYERNIRPGTIEVMERYARNDEDALQHTVENRATGREPLALIRL